jgi:hypothetical protein
VSLKGDYRLVIVPSSTSAAWPLEGKGVCGRCVYNALIEEIIIRRVSLFASSHHFLWTFPSSIRPPFSLIRLASPRLDSDPLPLLPPSLPSSERIYTPNLVMYSLGCMKLQVIIFPANQRPFKELAAVAAPCTEANFKNTKPPGRFFSTEQ